MAEADDPYIDEYGHSLFERALAAYDLWLDGIPYFNSGTAGFEAYAQRQFVRDVWPAVEQLCICLEANGKGELASRIERGFRDVEDYARLIDNYCESEKFDMDLWSYGDPARFGIDPVDDTTELLLEHAVIMGQPQEDEDFYHWSQGREWTRELGERCEQIEIEKYGHAAMDEYARHVAYWAWACFWLAVQLHHRRTDHHGAYQHLQGYLSGLCCVCETKDLVVREVLGRAFGMRIYPIAPMESEEVLRAIESFGTVVTETHMAILTAQDGASINRTTAPPLDEGPVTLVEFIQQHCQGGEKMSKSILDSRKTSIQNAAQAGNIILPDHVGLWKRGKPKYYRSKDLADQWAAYRLALPNLPPLKASPPNTPRSV